MKNLLANTIQISKKLHDDPNTHVKHVERDHGHQSIALWSSNESNALRNMDRFTR